MARKRRKVSDRPRRGKTRKRSSKAVKFRLPGARSKRNITPIWDLDRDGITYTALSKFVICPERYRLWQVEGWTESSIKVPLEFGSAFHYCLEMAAKGHGPEEIPRLLKSYVSNRIRESGKMNAQQQEELSLLVDQVHIVWEQYREYWGGKDQHKTYIIQEQAFRVRHRLPSGRVILLRGRWDEAYRDLEDENRVYLQENKTRANIDQEGLQASLAQDLQTMFYVFTLACHLTEMPAGVLYNVIRRPQLRQRKGEANSDFLDRIQDDVAARPEWYYMRWKTCLEPGDVENWVSRSLNPLLERVVAWWDSIKEDPLNPWETTVHVPNGLTAGGQVQTTKEKARNPHHYQRPFGVYDGGYDRGDFFELLTRGSHYGLVRREVPFPELEDEED